MVLVFTKWSINSSASVPWLDVVTFNSQYSPEHLPDKFTPQLYVQFSEYVYNLGTSFSVEDILWYYNAKSESGDFINARVLVDEAAYQRYKVDSDKEASRRDALILEMDLSREVKVNYNNATINAIISEAPYTYEQFNSLFNSMT